MNDPFHDGHESGRISLTRLCLRPTRRRSSQQLSVLPNPPSLVGLRQSLVSYLAEIACTRRVWPKAVPGHPELESLGCTVEDLLLEKGLLSWETIRVCEGQKGPLVAGFARLRVYVSAERRPASERWLLLRNDPNQKIKYALSNAPETCELIERVRVSGARWPIERNRPAKPLCPQQRWTAWIVSEG